MNELKWYVVRAVSGQEKKVKSYLDTEIVRQGLQEVITQVLIPMEKVYQMRNGKKKIREKTFFPGYILISADLTHGEAKHTITSIPGVLGFLSESMKSKEPVPLRASEVNRILGRVDDVEEEEEKMDAQYSIGESVKVMDGPFNGFIGSIEEVLEEKRKLVVMVKIFGRNAPVELNYMQVEKQL